MVSRNIWAPAAVLLAGALLFSAHAQFRGRGGGRRYRFEATTQEELKEQGEMEKAIVPGFREDTFTFARLKFDNFEGSGRFGSFSRAWDDDAPQADLTLTYRLFQTTSIAIRPGVTIIDITTDELQNYPFVYLASAGRVILDEAQVAALRHYLLNGGFLMADDFWGDEQWHQFYSQIKLVFPDREPVELALDNPIFHTVFELRKLPQIPSVGTYFRYRTPYEPNWPYVEKSHEPHYYALYDDKHRMMALICHNNHYGDGWEHEGDDESYFDVFSEPMGYPMMINLLYYTMTH